MRMMSELRRMGLWALGAALIVAPAAWGQNEHAQKADVPKSETKPAEQPAPGAANPTADKAAEAAPAGQAEAVGPPGDANIVAVEATHDFGEIWSGNKIDHTFEVKNTGTSILKINKVKPSCGCTVAKQYDKEIAPGATGKIPISIDTTRLQSRITKTISVESNDPDEATMRLTVTGTVNQRVSIEPNNGGTFGRVKPNELLKRTLTLKNNTETPVELTLKNATTGAFKAELKEIEKGKVYEMAVETVPSTYENEYNRGQFELGTNIADQAVVSVPVNVYVLPAVEVTPPEVIIPAPQPTVRKQPVAVTFNTEETHKVLAANIDAENVKVEVSERRPNNYTVELELPPNYVPPSGGHKLTIKTDYEKQKEIVVNLSPKKLPPPTPPQGPPPVMTLLGKPAPSATFRTSDEKMIATDDRGSASFYMFYASWCGYCKKALPSLHEYAKEFGDKGVRFVGVSQDTLVEDGNDPEANPRAKTKEFVVDQWKGFNPAFPVAFDPDKAGSTQFKVSGFPTMFLVGKDGNVERVYVGIGAITDGTMKKDFEMAAKGEKLPPQPVAAPAAPAATAQRPAQQLEGQPAPAAKFATADGQSYTLVEDGKTTVAMFYASWCGFCKKALPILQTMSTEMAGQPVRFVAVSLDSLVEDGADPAVDKKAKKKEEVVKQFTDMGVTFPQAFDPEKAGSNLFKVQSFPTLFLIDGKGKINKVYMGAGAAMDGSLKKDIEAAMKGGEKADAGGTPEVKLAADAPK
ncbi:MAG: redoxin family protein [Phycisphaerales bacterium]|nr:redoxin family protein [Phycisphaerales bacterium]